MENNLQKRIQVTFKCLSRAQYENQIPRNKLQGTKINTQETLYSINLSIPKHDKDKSLRSLVLDFFSHLRGTVLPAFRVF